MRSTRMVRGLLVGLLSTLVMVPGVAQASGRAMSHDEMTALAESVAAAPDRKAAMGRLTTEQRDAVRRVVTPVGEPEVVVTEGPLSPAARGRAEAQGFAASDCFYRRHYWAQKNIFGSKLKEASQDTSVCVAGGRVTSAWIDQIWHLGHLGWEAVGTPTRQAGNAGYEGRGVARYQWKWDFEAYGKCLASFVNANRVDYRFTHDCSI